LITYCIEKGKDRTPKGGLINAGSDHIVEKKKKKKMNGQNELGWKKTKEKKVKCEKTQGHREC